MVKGDAMLIQSSGPAQPGPGTVLAGETVTEMVNLELSRGGKWNKAMPVRTLGCPPLPVLTSVMKQK